MTPFVFIPRYTRKYVIPKDHSESFIIVVEHHLVQNIIHVYKHLEIVVMKMNYYKKPLLITPKRPQLKAGCVVHPNQSEINVLFVSNGVQMIVNPTKMAVRLDVAKIHLQTGYYRTKNYI